jgi:hypothetical protein
MEGHLMNSLVINEIDEEITRLQAARALLLGGSGGSVSSGKKTRKAKGTGRKPMSAAGRAKIAAAQKARWAKVRAEKKK